MIELIKNSAEVSIEGTHLEGQINYTFDSLVRIFGIPHYTSSDYKSLANWCLLFKKDNYEFCISIYDYKESWLYMGDTGLDLSKINDWHIGAKNHLDVVYFYEYLESQNDLLKQRRIKILEDQIKEKEEILQECKQKLSQLISN